MKLLQYIELYIDSCLASLSTSAIEKDVRCKNCLSEFLNGEDVDLRSAQCSNFIVEFAKFLREKSPKLYSVVTILEILGSFRKFVRSAISKNIIPNVDVFPYAINQIVKGTKAESTVGKLNMSEYAKDLQHRSKVEKLLLIIARWDAGTALRQRPSNDTEYRRQREYAYNLRCAALYLFSMFCYGINLREVISLKKSDIEEDDNIYLQSYAKRLPLLNEAKRLIQLYNRENDYSTNQYIFSILNGEETPEDIEYKVNTIKKRIIRFLSKESISLFKSRNTFEDWISLAMESGLSAGEAEKLVKACVNNNFKNIDEEILLRANSLFADGSNSLTEEWFLLRIFVPRLNASKLKKRIIASGLLGAESISSKKIYDPVDAQNDRTNRVGNSLSRFLFFKSTHYGCSLINRMVKGVSVLRDRATGKFAVIKQKELQTMQYMLRDFRDDVELINKTEWLHAQQERIKVGGKVKILEGSLKGHEASIIEIKNSTELERTYLLEFVEGNITFKTKLTGIKLQVIE